MKIENPPLIAELSSPGKCELCGKLARIREAHHLRRKNHGGGGRLDLRINLISLGGTAKTSRGGRRFSCHCHRLTHDGNLAGSRILEVVAARERICVETITEVMDLFSRLIKPTETQLLRALDELSDAGLSVAVRELREAGVITDRTLLV